MVAGLTDRIWTIEELLHIRVRPLFFYQHQKGDYQPLSGFLAKFVMFILGHAPACPYIKNDVAAR
jgi:hypothetical protein